MNEIENLKELRIKYQNGNRRTKDQILTSLRLVHPYYRKSAFRLMYRELRPMQAQAPVETSLFWNTLNAPES